MKARAGHSLGVTRGRRPQCRPLVSTAGARHHARLRQLLQAADTLGDDEIAVLALVATRLARGRGVYGPLHLDHDPRNFAAEALEEFADAACYLSAALVQHGRRRAARG
jgi:hypothetical protein